MGGIPHLFGEARRQNFEISDGLIDRGICEHAIVQLEASWLDIHTVRTVMQDPATQAHEFAAVSDLALGGVSFPQSGVPSAAMATQPERVFREALQLKPSDRTELLDLLIESLDPESEEGVEEAWMQEIDRRIAEIDSGAVRTEPWDVVRKRLRNAAGD